MKKLIKTLVRLQETLGMLLLSVFFLAILVQIAARYLAIPLLWTEEVANYTFIWAVFMGASVMVHNKAHFAFTFFSDKFQGRKGAFYDVFLSTVLISFTIPMTLYGTTVVREFWDYNWITLPWVKMGYTWLCLPITGGAMTLYLAGHIIEDIRVLASGEAAS
ncbi:MAG: TRAP transporter small permease [Synergistaceae bacterium]|uniref:TRAP transporter small permease n=1 Tax=Aminivibrio sp. TaxID=1872489 RepID=UPI001E04AFD2|nr:TRAP transporter small permease [Synergistaceae bacterium]NCC56011.1 TRAP transporter small permease [Synergistales bacterium]MDD3390159.1 TRAP transporter small permease [Synergistaceae bacterium]MDD3689995.1 TRAP transporter small permease [Synergistaceae bacterium]MDD4021966.1 TRAP transporter small permease [Synergistaceae bacterium]